MNCHGCPYTILVPLGRSEVPAVYAMLAIGAAMANGVRPQVKSGCAIKGACPRGKR